MPESKSGRTLMVECMMGPDVAAALRYLAAEQERGNYYNIQSSARARRWWNQVPCARYYTTGQGWRTKYGGCTIRMWNPWTQRSITSVICWTTAETSRLILELDASMQRGGMIIQEVEGRWYAHIRFKGLGNVSADKVRKLKARGYARGFTERVEKEPWYTQAVESGDMSATRPPDGSA